MERSVRPAVVALGFALAAAGCGSALDSNSKGEAAMAPRTATTPAEAAPGAPPAARLETATFSLG
jgi:hypothetical protein